jgi:kinetochore protein Spc25
MASATFSTSTSSHHAATSPSSPYHDNPLYQLPRVEFNFEDLRARMTAFTAKFDAFIEKGRKRVLEERNEFKARLSELGGV